MRFKGKRTIHYSGVLDVPSHPGMGPPPSSLSLPCDTFLGSFGEDYTPSIPPAQPPLQRPLSKPPKKTRQDRDNGRRKPFRRDPAVLACPPLPSQRPCGPHAPLTRAPLGHLPLWARMEETTGCCPPGTRPVQCCPQDSLMSPRLLWHLLATLGPFSIIMCILRHSNTVGWRL